MRKKILNAAVLTLAGAALFGNGVYLYAKARVAQLLLARAWSRTLHGEHDVKPWSWADTYHQFINQCPNVAVVEMMEAFHSFLKNSPMMAYLAMMAPRLVELHRVLKETGASICIAIQLPVITYEPCWMGSSMHETSERKLSGNGVVRTVMLLKDECSMDRFMTRYSFTRRVAIGRGIAFLLSTIKIT